MVLRPLLVKLLLSNDMLYKTQGIVLNYIKYKESSVIAKIFTDLFGIQSYVINGVRSSKSKKGSALLQPLTLLDLVVYHNKKAESLQRLSEYRAAYAFQSIPFDIKKSTIALFITELLAKVLKEEEEQHHVFEFLGQTIRLLDAKTSEYENLHVYLMIKLTHFVGFGIHNRNELIKDNILQKVSTSFDEIFDTILEINSSSIESQPNLTNRLRKDVMSYMINYYHLHVEGFKDMKSLDVLSQIFRD